MYSPKLTLSIENKNSKFMSALAMSIMSKASPLKAAAVYSNRFICYKPFELVLLKYLELDESCLKCKMSQLLCFSRFSLKWSQLT